MKKANFLSTFSATGLSLFLNERIVRKVTLLNVPNYRSFLPSAVEKLVPIFEKLVTGGDFFPRKYFVLWH